MITKKIYSEYRDAQKLTMKHEVKSEEEYKTLEECLENITSEPVVGLENITEYRSPNHTTPYYHCDLEVSLLNSNRELHKI